VREGLSEDKRVREDERGCERGCEQGCEKGERVRSKWGGRERERKERKDPRVRVSMSG
jgi:hypothetical protein